MNLRMRIAMAIVASVFVSAHASGQTSPSCLEDATDRQLVTELERRLYLGEGGNDDGAIASFFCDSSTYLIISLLNQSGVEKTQQVYTGSNTDCRDTLEYLRAFNDVRRMEVIAVCDSSTYLNRFALRPDGTITALDKRYLGSRTECRAEEQAINTRH